ncbi:unnamed protein product [Lactuca virosa]|uniref:C3H1-type domain-containing protein n=1 Tax=Lactuca virosa TaxID=75947 RepID=A0AAU9MVC6_9ASTR|nr:unnamed protein product [Lactuca virosa]
MQRTEERKSQTQLTTTAVLLSRSCPLRHRSFRRPSTLLISRPPCSISSPHKREKAKRSRRTPLCSPVVRVHFVAFPFAACRRLSPPVAVPVTCCLSFRYPPHLSASLLDFFPKKRLDVITMRRLYPSFEKLKLFEALFVVHRNSAIFVVHRNSVSTKYDDEWKYIEEGPPEIIWKGNEIIVNKNKVKVKKKEANQSTQKEDPDRPTSNPLPPQSEAYAAFKNAPIASTELLDIVSQQVPNFGTEKDKAHCPFYIKTGACRFGMRCNRFISTLINLPHCLSRTCTMDLAMLRNKMRDLRSVVGFSL